MLNRSAAPLLVLLLAFPITSGAQTSATTDGLLRIDTAQAAMVLSMLEGRLAGRIPGDEQWAAQFATEGYLRLKEREHGMRRAFTDSAFEAFVMSDTLLERTGALRRAFTEWSRADLDRAASRVLAYLPKGSQLRATVYIVIKPQTNSFVWDLSGNPAVFLYLDPDVTAAKLENTIAHELHHIGLGALGARHDSIVQLLPERTQLAAGWMGAFGEGFAMLAAAGGPDAHPHAVSGDEERSRWDRDVARFNDDLRRLDQFFLDVIEGKLASEDSVRRVAMTFYGVQGPWYTVGWKMATTIEQQLGRDELIQCLTNPFV